MKINEDLLTILRGIIKRPVESLLLIFGIALGIGATASGISIVAQTTEESRAILAETRYREIVVRARESAAEMELPAALSGSGNEVIITANDLAARNEAPAVQYAYVANNTHVRFGNFGFDRNFREADNRGSSPPGTTDNNQAGSGQENAGNNNAGFMRTGSDDASGNMDGPPAGMPQGWDLQPGDMQREPPFQSGEIPEPGQPADGRDPAAADANTLQPTIEELNGYEVSHEYFAAFDLSAAAGSLFTEEDIRQREPVMVLGAEIAQTLFDDGIALDRQLQIRRDLYTIIGILEPTGTQLDTSAFFPTVIPDTSNRDPRMFIRSWNTALRFTVADTANLEEAKAQLNTWFDQTYGVGKVAISIPREEAEALANRNSRLVTIILILAVSGLLIASVNVSNILYSRAIRKRKAIGIMKALGATRRHIFILFFTEALVIGMGGALGGTGIAILLSGLMQSSLGVGGYSIGILGLGVLLSLVTTLFLTNIPAMQTSKIPASEAIRYE